MFVYPATVAEKTREVKRLGIDAHVDTVHWSEIRDRIFASRIDRISEGGRDWRAGLPNVDFYAQYAHFVGSHTLELTGRHPTARSTDCDCRWLSRRAAFRARYRFTEGVHQ